MLYLKQSLPKSSCSSLERHLESASGFVALNYRLPILNRFADKNTNNRIRLSFSVSSTEWMLRDGGSEIKIYLNSTSNRNSTSANESRMSTVSSELRGATLPGGRISKSLSKSKHADGFRRLEKTRGIKAVYPGDPVDVSLVNFGMFEESASSAQQ